MPGAETSERNVTLATRHDGGQPAVHRPSSLKATGRDADGCPVKFDRLVIEHAEHRVTFDLHPRLTVVAGLGQLERDGLINEFVGALGSSRPGVHLELTADDGHRFALFRPVGDTHRVIDVDAREDVTAHFVGPDGEIDLLQRAELDQRSARRAMRITSEDLVGASETSERIRRLSSSDQDELWRAADDTLEAERRLEDEARAAGGNVEDAEVIASIEEHHERFEQTQAESEQVRRATFLIAGIAALLSIPLAPAVGAVIVAPLAMIAVLAVVTSFVTWRRAERARSAETDALAEAGAQSYLGFHLQRVNGLLASDLSRQRLLHAADEHRDAQRAWEALAGDTPAAWALARRDTIVAAARAQREMDGLTEPGAAPEETGAIVHEFLGRLDALRHLGPGGESFPALLDEPFEHLPAAALPTLLETLVLTTEHQQVVLLSSDERLADWARVESMTGTMSLVEPVPTATVDIT